MKKKKKPTSAMRRADHAEYGRVVAQWLALPADQVRGLKLNINWGALIFEVAKLVIEALAHSISGDEPLRKGRRRKA